jgi:hypothetical protein
LHPDHRIPTIKNPVPGSFKNAAEMLKMDRAYWGIERGLHQRLDVSSLENKNGRLQSWLIPQRGN